MIRALSKTVHPFRQVWRFFVQYRLTDPGKVLFTAAFFSWLMSVANPFFHIAVGLTLLPIVTIAVALLYRPKLQVDGPHRVKSIVGQPCRLRYRLTNRGRLPAYSAAVRFFHLPKAVEIKEIEDVIPTLPPGKSVNFDIELTAKQRGLYRLPYLRAYSTFPFNLFRFGRSVQSTLTLIVLPQIAEVRSMALMSRQRHQPGGILMASHIGESPEYVGNREFRPGDSTRRLDVRAWARLSYPVVREYQDEYFQHVAVVLDTFAPSRRHRSQPFEPLEAAIRLTAGLAERCNRDDAVVDLFAVGSELYTFRTGRQTAPTEAMLEILAGVQPCKRSPFETLAQALATELQRDSAVAFVFIGWDQQRRKLIRQALEAGCMVKTIIIAPDKKPLPYPTDLDNVLVLQPGDIGFEELVL